MVLGITGGIGSGKSYVANCFLELANTVYYHADEEAKKLMNTSKKIIDQVVEYFGEEAYKEGALNRAYLSSIVFKDASKLQKLNAIVHPVVKEHFQEFVNKQSKEAIVIYENAILFEAQSDQYCDYVLTVTAPVEERIRRVMLRDQLSQEAVEQRIKNQWSEDKKILLSHYIILNINKKATMLKVRDIHNNLTKKQSLF